MKEATGELNMTVVTVVAIAALMLFFYAIIWPTIKVGLALNSACSSAGTSDYEVNGDGYTINCKAGTCTYTDPDNPSKSNSKICTASKQG